MLIQYTYDSWLAVPLYNALLNSRTNIQIVEVCGASLCCSDVLKSSHKIATTPTVVVDVQEDFDML